jgi:hypothetical protein
LVTYLHGNDYEKLSAARVAYDGTVLDPFGLEIAEGIRDGYFLTAPVVHVGTHWIAVWENRCTRISHDGVILDPGGKRVFQVGRSVGLAFDGTDLLALADSNEAVRLDTSCTPVGSSFRVGPDWTSEREFEASGLSFDGSHYVATYTQSDLGLPDRLLAQRISVDGMLVGDPIMVREATWARDSMDTEGWFGVNGNVASRTGFSLVAYGFHTWNPTTRFGEPGVLMARTLGTDGGLGEERLLSTKPSGRLPSVQAAWQGFAVAREDDLLELDADGNPLATSQQRVGALAFDGTRLFAALGEPPPQLAILDSNLERLHETTILLAKESAQYNVQVACNGEVYLVVWSTVTEDGTGERLFASRLSTSGQILDAEPLLLVDRSYYSTRAAVASNGSDFLVAWSDTDIKAKRVTGSGRIVDEIPIDVTGPYDSGGHGYPEIASNGSDYLVAWRFAFSYELSHPGPTLVAARVSARGKVLDETPLILLRAPGVAYTENIHSVAVSSNGSSYFVTSHLRSSSGSSETGWVDSPIEIMRVDADGVVGQTVSTGQRGFVTSFVWGHDQGFLTWATESSELLGARVAFTGTLLDPEGFSISPPGEGPWNHDAEGSAAWDGHRYWVNWQGREGDLKVARVTEGGVVLDRDALAVLWAGGSVPGLFALAASGEQVLAAYPNWAGAASPPPSLNGRFLCGDSECEPGGGSGAAGEGGTAGESGAGGDGGVAGDTGGSSGSSGSSGRGGNTTGGGESSTGGQTSGGEGGDSSGSAARTGSAGSAGDAGMDQDDAERAAATDDSGCACRTRSHVSPSTRCASWVLGLLALSVLVRRRRLRSRENRPREGWAIARNPCLRTSKFFSVS